MEEGIKCLKQRDCVVNWPLRGVKGKLNNFIALQMGRSRGGRYL